MTTNRGVGGTEEVGRKLAIHDCDPNVVPPVPVLDITSGKERNAHGPEVSGRDGVHECLHIFAVFNLMSFDAHAGVPLAAGEETDTGECHVLHSRIAAQGGEHLITERTNPGDVIPVERRINLKADEV